MTPPSQSNVVGREPPAIGDREHRHFLLRLAVVMLAAVGLYARTFMCTSTSPSTTPSPSASASASTSTSTPTSTSGFGFSYLDDDALILDQQDFLSRPSSLWRSFGRPTFQTVGRDHAYYRPLVTVSYAVDAQTSGNRPRGYHQTNVFLHALATGLLFVLLGCLGHRQNVALWGGLVFAVHPTLTEAVAWIPGRNDSLLTVFALASWLLLLRASPLDGRVRKWGWLARIGHVVLWLAALCTKETAVVLPLVVLGHLRLVERRPWRALLPTWLLAGWLVALGVYLTARAAVLPEHLGAAGLSAATFFSNLPVLVSSLGKLVLPVHLSVLAIPQGTSLLPGVLGAGLILGAWFVPRIRRAEVLFGVATYVAAVAPGLATSNLLVLESRLYLPAVGILIVACELARALAWPAPAKIAAAAVVVVVLAAASFSYSADFRDRLTFARAAVQGSPHSALAHRNLGVAYQISGDEELARREYESALAEDAGEPVAHNNLGVLFMAKGQLPDAERELRQELAINPRYLPAHRNLALVLDAVGRSDDAASHWETVLDLDAGNIGAMRALLDYFGPRDPAKAARFRAMLEAHGAAAGMP